MHKKTEEQELFEEWIEKIEDGLGRKLTKKEKEYEWRKFI
jgi:hypothetical protein